MADQRTAPVPFQLADNEIQIDLSTRELGFKWVMVVNRDLPSGLIANTTGCMAAAVGKAIPALVGPGGTDASGTDHVGLPWSGCTVLGAEVEKVREIREKSRTKSGLFVVDMPETAQICRVYGGYLNTLSTTASENITYHGVSIVGPRNKVDKLVGRLPLLG
ncbi:DUF2000 domain-containing protein [Salinactinospora qingdaonensis]|uniref:DUF2000 domain-containing protein n=1 Tax=Salinactinospora qingdaonensis TaxID=702744 RepID=A0ABP7G0K6_9ACTN